MPRRVKMQDRPSPQSSTFFMKYDGLMLFPFRHFFDIYPMLVATRLEMSKHFLSEGCRPVIEQRGSYAEHFIIVTFSHFEP
jgi:hypothetical protein